MILYFQSEGICDIQADVVANILICSIAINTCQTNARSVAVIGNDKDLLAILIARGISGTSLYILRPLSANYEEKYYNITKTQEDFGPITDAFLFLHVPTRCNTISAISRKGKSTAFKLIKENQELCSLISHFNIPHLDPQKVIEIGEVFLKHLFRGKQIKSLDDLRYILYNKEGTNTLSLKFNLATLPPTSAAFPQHSLRVYLQVQQWLRNSLDPIEWGWLMKDGILNTVPSTLPAASEVLLQFISCHCKINLTRDCDSRCQCKKGDLHCAKFCTSCLVETCKNSATPTNGFEDAADDE
ncbi:hypothetical protein AVEN_234261-1 [Araneus ventricosus]|uniref:Tesmin/TSO1-like CXC domain-containing protein n=1 Tax=Araneus ventricosus TaxID=182803 RepID=A0A4Y2A968_ARAVE|nr:hypothetical protein AVEN_234261-1 [Araneus ventricosus]